MEKVALKQRLAQVREAVAEAVESANRDPEEVTVIGVTKRKPLSAVLMAYELGMRHFGENQVQEGLSKVEAAPKDIHWHLIGHLQKNKVRPAVKGFETIHSVDSLKLLRRVDRIAGEEGRKPNIFLQVNLVLDPDKFGLKPEEVASVLDIARACQHLVCVGLMAIPPFEYSSDETELYFRDLRNMRDDLKRKHPDWPGWLSFGMSRDYLDAIRMGSHFVRVGTVIFGERS